MYVGIGLLAVCAVVLLGWNLYSRKARAQLDTNEGLLDTIIERQSPGAGRQRRTASALPRTMTGALRPTGGGPQLSVLEGHLRNAILNADARERLVKDAMRVTGGDRAAAISKVLRDLHEEDKRLS
jgi:hypothetical protein